MLKDDSSDPVGRRSEFLGIAWAEPLLGTGELIFTARGGGSIP